MSITVEEGFGAIINGPEMVCVGETVTFSATEFGPGVTYSWNFGPLASPSTANTSSVNVTWNSITSPTITLTVTNASAGCTSTNQMAIAVTDSPIFCGPGIINMVANVNNNGTVGLNWTATDLHEDITMVVQRSEDGVNFTDLQAMSIHNNSTYNFVDVAPMRGQNAYRVMLTDELQQVMYSEIAMVEIASSRDLFFLYPNPFTNELTISVDEEVTGQVQVEVFNAQGQMAKSLQLQGGNYGEQLDMANMPSGIYYVHFQFGAQGKRVVKIIKE